MGCNVDHHKRSVIITHLAKINTNVHGAVHTIINNLHVLTKYAINVKISKLDEQAIHTVFCTSGRCLEPTASPAKISMEHNNESKTPPPKNQENANIWWKKRTQIPQLL